MTNRKLIKQSVALASAIAMAAGGFAACGQDKVNQDPAAQAALPETGQKKDAENAKRVEAASKNDTKKNTTDHADKDGAQASASETASAETEDSGAETDNEAAREDTSSANRSTSKQETGRKQDEKPEASGKIQDTGKNGKTENKDSFNKEETGASASDQNDQNDQNDQDDQDAKDAKDAQDDQETQARDDAERETMVFELLADPDKDVDEMSEIEVLEYSRALTDLVERYRLDMANATDKQKDIAKRADELFTEGYKVTESDVIRPDGTSAYAEPDQEIVTPGESEREIARQKTIFNNFVVPQELDSMTDVDILEWAAALQSLAESQHLDLENAGDDQKALLEKADELIAAGYRIENGDIIRPDGTSVYASGEDPEEQEPTKDEVLAGFVLHKPVSEMTDEEAFTAGRALMRLVREYNADPATHGSEEQLALMQRFSEMVSAGYSMDEEGNLIRPEEQHEHTWEEDTEVVHHDAEYETVHHEAETAVVKHDAEYETVHHEAEYEDVEHPAEYDIIHHDAETEEIEHPAEVETVRHEAGTETVHHDAEYETVHHEAEYETVHHDEVTEEVEHPAETETVHHEAEYETVHHEEETEPVHHEAEYEEVEHPAEVETVHHEAEAEDVEHPAEVEIIHHDAEVETVHHDAVYETVHHEAETEAVHHDAEYETMHHEAVYEVVHHEAEYEMVHHDAVEEERYVVDKAAWDEDVYEEVEVCADCGFTSKDGDILEHMLAGMENGTCSGSYYTENVVVDTIHHDEVGHTETVVVEEAWDEEVCTKEAYDEEVLTEEAYDEQVLIAEGWEEIVVTKEAYDEEVLTEEAYDEEVVVKEAWDETVENPGSAASEEAANTIEKDIYFIEHEYEGHLTMDDGSVGSVKLESSSKTQGTPKYEVVSGRSAVVSEDGVVTPRATTYYLQERGDGFGDGFVRETWTTAKIDGAESYQAYDAGDTVIRAKYDDHEDLYTIHVGSYAERYTNRKCQEIADEICADPAKSKVDQAEAITRYVAENSSYSVGYGSAESILILGKGDCIASTDTIIRIAEMAGLEARAHNAMGQAGAGAGHMNVLFRIDGKYYIADAGMNMPAPRYYSFYEEADGIDGNRKTGWMRQYDRFDEDAVVPDWVTTLRNTVSDINNQLYEDSVFGRNDRNLVKTVSIPDSVKDISNVAFDTCYSLTDINVSEGNRHYKSVDGSLYTKSGSTLLFVPTAKKIVTVAAGTQKIADYAFGISEAEKVVLPYGLKSIDEGAFYSAHVNEVTIPKSVTFIHDTAFEVYNARNFKLRVYEGTYAERFAKEHNIPYETIEEKPETVTKTITAKRKVKDAYDETVVKKAAYDEQKLVKAAWDEEVVTKDAYDEQKVVKEAWIETVVTKPAYDETIVVKDAWKERVKVREAYDETVVTKPAYDEQVLVQDAWDEIVTTKPAWVETVVTTPAFDEQVLVKAAWDEQILVQDAWDEEIVVSEAYDEDVVVKDAWTETVVTKPAYDEEVLVSAAWTETVKTRDAFDEQVLVTPAWEEEYVLFPAWDEKVLVKAAWDEVISHGYTCSTCGKTAITM